MHNTVLLEKAIVHSIIEHDIRIYGKTVSLLQSLKMSDDIVWIYFAVQDQLPARIQTCQQPGQRHSHNCAHGSFCFA